MKDANFVVIGKNRAEISELVYSCAYKIDTGDSMIVAFSDVDGDSTVSGISSADCVILRHGRNKHPEWGVPVITYAMDDSSADVAAINVQSREHGYSFEILNGCSIGRVFVPDGCRYTREDILVTVSMFCGAGVPMKNILETVNGLIK